ncbi:MAG: ribosomal protein S18-alanine N-acetyltransferase [Burkholderiales bacterium]|jgi:ribosomal-protein-alanine N-acetyltransferase|nr:ribosomal protein S18-alanine N-acetyltransferase [Burkholderiales bacterium]
MYPHDVDRVMALETDLYSHPWTRGNFEDSLSAGYSAWIAERGSVLVGYGVMMMGVEEAHLLNLSVARHAQRQGLGRELLAFFVDRAREFAARAMFLEVRPSNAPGRALYAGSGFRELAVRRGYYPATGGGREDALLMGRDL